MTRRLACALVLAAACALSGCGSGDEADAPAASGQEPAATVTPEATESQDRGYGY